MIPALQFSKQEVLFSPEEKKERKRMLKSATALSSLEHEPISLIVKLADGENVEIESDLIEYEHEYVELKGGYEVPVEAIVKVEI